MVESKFDKSLQPKFIYTVPENSQLRPYNLQEACERFFANTHVQPCDLLWMARKKKLRLIKINKETLVTEEAIQEMIETCQGKENQPDCSRKNEQVVRRSGSLSMPDAKSAQAAAEKTFAELIKHSKTT